MSILSQLNSPAMYAICGGIVAFVALICIVFLIRAWRAGLAIGMDRTKMKRVIVSSATFSALPSVGILLGVIALSGSLGTPWPWLRLSVIGALHYETQVAQAAAEQVGMKSLSAAEMNHAAEADAMLADYTAVISPRAVDAMGSFAAQNAKPAAEAVQAESAKSSTTTQLQPMSLSPVFQISGMQDSQQLRSALNQSVEDMRQMILDVVQSARDDEERMNFS